MAISEKSFSEYMYEVLYGDDGFYTKGNGAGRDRDYITSPEIGDLFGAVIAGYINKWFSSLDDQSQAVILEVGSGPGTLASSIAHAGLKESQNISYLLVDISKESRETAKNKMTRANASFDWEVLETIPELDVPTLVLSNELLDNLIFDIGFFKESYTNYKPDEYDRTGNPAYAFLGQFRDIDMLKAASVPKGLQDFRIPLHVGIASFFDEIEQATAQVSDLAILMFDYMKSVVDMHDENWLRLYSKNERIVGLQNVLSALSQGVVGDITTDVTKEDLYVILDSKGFSNTRIVSQAKWLENNLIDSYLEEIKLNNGHINAYEMAKGFIENPSASKLQGYRKERDILMDPQGLGAFSVLQSRRAV